MPSSFLEHPDALRTETTWFIGTVLAAVSYGVLVTLGISCLVLLYPQAVKPASNLQKFLLGYISLLILLNTGFGAVNARLTHYAIFQLGPGLDSTTNVYTDQSSSIIAVCIVLMTDGLLTWRCFMLNQVLSAGRSTIFRHLSWIIPVLLWMTTAACGIVAFVVSPSNPGYLAFAIGFLSNVFLNLFVTITISTRLLLHRRWATSLMGGRTRSHDGPHLHVITILAESAAVSIPFSLLATLGDILKQPVGTLAYQVTVPCQAIGTFVIIHGALTGRTVVGMSRKEKEGSSVTNV